MNIYVASSWRNERQPDVIHALRQQGHDIYDFRNPRPGDRGFHWSEIDPAWQTWTPEQFRDGLQHELAAHGFAVDMSALTEVQIVVLVLPCGRSAHLEFGHAVGSGARGLILLSDGEPELMYRMADRLCVDLDELLDAVGAIEEEWERFCFRRRR